MIIFDIGATKTRIAFAENFDSFDEPIIYNTPISYTEGIEIICKMINECAAGREIKSITGGVAGVMDRTNTILSMSTNLPDWKGRPIVEDIEKRCGIKPHIENDSAMVALGETYFGAGKGTKNLGYITVSTGVGGARIVDGKIDRAFFGFEPGYLIMDTENQTTLEEEISGKSIETKTGRKAFEVNDSELWEKYAKILAIGLNNVSVLWSPEKIVLGGSMITGTPSIPIDKTIEHLKSIMKAYPEIPEIKKAELGDLGGLYGSLSFIKNSAKN